MAIELYCNQSINGTLTTTGTGTFGGDVLIGGTTGSSGNALAVNRGSNGDQALRVQNSGEVVIPSNYLFCNAPSTSLYVQNTAVFRGSIINDGGDVTINDTLRVNDDATFQNSNVTINGTTSNTVPALKVTESGDNLFEVGPTNTITFRLGDVDGLGDETFIEGSYSDIKFKGNSNTTAIFDGNNRVTINSSTAGAYQLGVNGIIATTSSIAWGMSNLGNSPSFSMGVDSSSGYLEIDEVTTGGTLKIATDNTRIGSGQVYLEGGLTSATPSQYLGRVTGGGGGVMVGRTAAQVLADIGAAPATGGAYLPLAGGTMTGLITDLECANDLVTGRTGVGNIYAKDSGNTFWQVFKSGSTTYMTTSGSSSDSIFLGAPTSSVTTNLTVSGNLQTGNTGDGSLTLKQSGTMFLQMFSQYSTAFINTGTSGSTIYFGNTTSLVQNVNVAGFLDADNFKINNSQGTSGQVMTSTGSGVSWQTPTSGTVTGSGASNKLAVWTTGANIVNTKITDISNSGFYALDNYTATAVSTTGPIDPNQNAQAASQDTLATLAVDPSGNVVRGEQEATFKFTLAQLNSTLGQTLISAPGADKAVVITYTDYMMEYSSTGTTSNNLEIRQANYASANASVSVLPSLRFNEIVSQSQSGSAPFYGFYTRDIPTGSGSQGRTYAVNKATTIHKQNSGAYPSGLTSISIKIRYRIFDVDTF